MITRSNYEIYFVDYFDGSLDKNQVGELFAFLEINPDLKAEFDSYPGVKAEVENRIVFGDKERLKRETITLYNYKSWFVASVENDLSDAQKAELNSFLNKNKILKPELELFKRSRFVPESEIIFSKKIELKKKGIIIQFPILRQVAAAAAVAAIFILSYFFIQKQNSKSDVAYKEIKNEKPESKENSVQKASVQKEIANQNLTPVVPENKSANMQDKKPGKFKKVKDVPNTNTELAVSPPDQDLNNPDIEVKENTIALNSEMNDSIVTNKSVEADLLRKKEIFTDEEIRDLQNLSSAHTKKEEPTSSFLNLAEKKIKKLTAPTDVSFDTEKSTNAVTYAFGVGKYFNVSHTTTK